MNSKRKKNTGPDQFLKFLGTAGARFVMIKQLRSSGGLWLAAHGVNVIIDPGPGAIYRCAAARPKLEATKLDAVILTHKHLDHSNDVNVMVEAMTEGGFKKRGVLFAPRDALDEKEGVVFSYLKEYPQCTVELKPGEFSVGNLSFTVPGKNTHSVETYGLKFTVSGQVVSIVSDTRWSRSIPASYGASDVLVLNVVFLEPRAEYDHLSLPEAVDIIKAVKPRLAVLTHFGMTMVRAKIHTRKDEIAAACGCPVMFAYDGLTLPLPYSKGTV